MAFEYSQLSSSSSKRLLKVLSRTDQIHIRLWEEEGGVPYRCLSYTWGEPTPCFPIYVNGKSMQVGENLYKFLVTASRRYSHELFWIDAICINQSDNSEKSVQVQRMGNIYEEAIEVLIWLGDNPELAEYIDWKSKQKRRIIRANVYKSMDWFLEIYKTRSPRRFQEGADLLNGHPYWTRVWIIQEIYLAQSLSLACGLATAHSDRFTKDWRYRTCGSLTKLAIEYNWPKSLRPFTQDIDSFFRFLGLFRWPDSRYTSDYASLLQSRDYKKMYGGNFLGTFCNVACTADCHDPRDRIYGLLAIYGHQSTFKVDYGESCTGLFWRAAGYFDVWTDCRGLYAMWKALSLSEEDLSALSKQKCLRFEVPLRYYRLVQDVEAQELDRPPWATSPSCSNIGDLLCCPDGGDMTQLTNYFLFRRHRDVNTSSFQMLFTMESSELHKPCPADSELWYRANGEDTRILDWDAVLRSTEYGNLWALDWESRPHFVLKLSHEYVLQCVRLRQEHEETLKVPMGKNLEKSPTRLRQ